MKKVTMGEVTHELIAQDVWGGIVGQEVKVVEGSERLVRSRMVSEAGAMVQGGWWASVVVHDQITVEHYEDASRNTVFKMRSVA